MFAAMCSSVEAAPQHLGSCYHTALVADEFLVEHGHSMTTDRGGLPPSGVRLWITVALRITFPFSGWIVRALTRTIQPDQAVSRSTR